MRAYSQIREGILTGQLVPEARLKVEDLKQTLDVGASPIREALSLLTSDRLVERLDQRGFRVATANQAHFSEVLELRCMLEARALSNSIAKGGDSWRALVEKAHNALSKTERKDEMFEVNHKAFHMTLLSGAPAPVLLEICDQLYDQNVRYRHVAQKNKAYSTRDVSDEHAEIYDASIRGEAEYAVTLLQTHYRRTGQYLLKGLSELSPVTA